jgi:hypothetical protein
MGGCEYRRLSLFQLSALVNRERAGIARRQTADGEPTRRRAAPGLKLLRNQFGDTLLERVGKIANGFDIN